MRVIAISAMLSLLVGCRPQDAPRPPSLTRSAAAASGVQFRQYEPCELYRHDATLFITVDTPREARPYSYSFPMRWKLPERASDELAVASWHFGPAIGCGSDGSTDSNSIEVTAVSDDSVTLSLDFSWEPAHGTPLQITEKGVNIPLRDRKGLISAGAVTVTARIKPWED
jgi:hypothetical protein